VQFNGRWSLVGAAGYGTAHTERELFSATRDIWSGAVGFRYQLARLFGMHAGLDVGVSEARRLSTCRWATPGSGRETRRRRRRHAEAPSRQSSNCAGLRQS